MKNTFVKSFHFAFRGILLALHERNFRVQFFVALLVVFFMFFFRVKTWEAVTLVLVVVLVLTLEIMNSIFEKLSDILKPRLHEYIRHIKDLMAAAVLLTSLASIGIGVLIFWPYIRSFFL